MVVLWYCSSLHRFALLIVCFVWTYVRLLKAQYVAVAVVAAAIVVVCNES